MKKVGVALLGLGTVGGGTYRILTNNHDSIMNNYGVDIEIRQILERDEEKAKALKVDMAKVSCDIERVVNDKEISIVAEFFGGIEPAKTFLKRCLLAGKSIVTANKELFAKHWDELEAAAKKGKAGMYFEASCVGGVPIIRALQESMQGNNIRSIMGIVNGTTNYILSKMADEGREYGEALAEAQKLGYAEANPAADVEGFDSAYKLSILSSLAFRSKVSLEKIYREGITNITKEDIEYGKQFGYTLKLLAIGKRDGGKIEARVHPAFIPDTHPLAAVKGNFNAVHIVGDNVGDLMFYGRGAGDLPTGSAIVSDIVFASSVSEHRHSDFRAKSIDFSKDFVCDYYVRAIVKDQTGVLSSIAGVFAKFNVSINSMNQKAENGVANLNFMVHKTNESNIKKAITALKKLNCVNEIATLIRVEGTED